MWGHQWEHYQPTTDHIPRTKQDKTKTKAKTQNYFLSSSRHQLSLGKGAPVSFPPTCWHVVWLHLVKVLSGLRVRECSNPLVSRSRLAPVFHNSYTFSATSSMVLSVIKDASLMRTEGCIDLLVYRCVFRRQLVTLSD